MDFSSILTVSFVWLLIFCLGLAYFTLFLPALYKESQFWFWILTPICFISIIISCYSYFKAIKYSPGYSDPKLKYQYSQRIQECKSRGEMQKQYKILMKKKQLSKKDHIRQIQHLTEDSYCFKCQNVKIARTHHCSHCKKCIQRMDHHCPWVGNCIGRQNHKYFILFLLYIVISLICVFLSILLDYVTGQIVLYRVWKENQIYYYALLVVGIMSVILLFSVGFLFITQLILIFQNLTTLESFYEQIFDHNPFEYNSVRENFKQITGNSFVFLPTQPFPQHKQQKNIAFCGEQ